MHQRKYSTIVAEEIWQLNATLATILALSKSDAFDEKFYLSSYPEVSETGLSPIEHYVLYGSSEGKKPVWWFDTSLYLSHYKEIESTEVV